MQYELIAPGKSEKSKLLGKWSKGNMERKIKRECFV
jgi:hypothetical protein